MNQLDDEAAARNGISQTLWARLRVIKSPWLHCSRCESIQKLPSDAAVSEIIGVLSAWQQMALVTTSATGWVSGVAA